MSQSPYQPPSNMSHPQVTAGGGRPTSVTVLGILHLIFGGFGILGVLMTLALFVVRPAQQNIPNPTLELMEESTGFAIWSYATTLVGLGIVILQVVSAIGLLQLKPFGRKGLLIYSIYCMISALLMLPVNIYFMLPKLQELGGPVVGVTLGSMVIGGLFGLILPIATLIVLTRPNIKAAFGLPASA